MLQNRNYVVYSLTLQKLRVFAAVARERSFVKAAAALALTPPTVSEEVRALENTVGVKLLSRTRGRTLVKVTEAGEILLESYKEISESLAKANEALYSLVGLDRGTVEFGADVIFGGFLLPTVYDSFCRAHSHLTVHVEIETPARILESLREGRLDIAVLFGPNEEVDLVQEPLIPCLMVPVARFGHRLSGVGPVPFSELAKERLFLPGRFSRLRRILDQMAHEAGTSLNIAMEVANVDANLQSVLGGLGVAVLSTHCVASDLASGRLCTLQVEGFPISMDWFITYPDGKLMPGAQALRAHLLQSRRLLRSISHLPSVRNSPVRLGAPRVVSRESATKGSSSSAGAKNGDSLSCFRTEASWSLRYPGTPRRPVELSDRS